MKSVRFLINVMYSVYFTSMAARALLGGLRNITEMCLNDPRPKAQYMGYYRTNHKKISDLLGNWCIAYPKGDDYILLNKIFIYYNTHPKCTFESQKQVSEDIKLILQNYERGNQN